VTTLPFFLVEEIPSSSTYELGGPEGRHAATVRRMRAGELVQLSDGVGGYATCSVTGAAKDSLTLQVRERGQDPGPDLRVILAQALIKGERGELAVELSTEAGVDEIWPWSASRSIAKWEQGPRADKARARWQSTVDSAAKQARRHWVPQVSAALSTRQLAQKVAEVDLALVLHESAVATFAGIPLPDKGNLLVIVGPEGGVSDDELATLTTAGAQVVRLGPQVLRASTAGVVALGALGVVTPRWR
jgi:16S rRNA (uracil1498-N3)-methyltransferase